MWRSLLVCAVATSVYLNSLFCGFVFDDASAVKDNQDLRPITPWMELFQNDFWGTPLTQERSHKSYRPFTVLTFRLNYWIGELNPIGYHLFNILLHSLNSLIFLNLCSKYLDRSSAFVSALYFAVHPIHTEAVTGVVGRAELLSALMSQSILLSYEAIKDQSFLKHWCGLLALVGFLAIGTLCKEQCITIVGVLCANEFSNAYRSILKRYNVSDLWTFMGTLLKQPVVQIRCCLTHWLFLGKRRTQRLFFLLLCSVGIVYFRIRIMGSQLPHFTEFDNPAAHAKTLVRRLTHSYLIPVNLFILLYPSGLCADWTLGSVRLIEGWMDARNLSTLLAFVLLLIIIIIAIHPNTRQQHASILVLAIGLMIFSFLPASNLFFPVGFVIAERVLYTPSLGVSLLFGLGYQSIIQYTMQSNRTIKCSPSNLLRPFQFTNTKMVLNMLVTWVLIAFSLKTVHRNFDWTNELSLFSSALKVNPNNAKMWNNVGHALEATGRYHVALGYFEKAVEVQPNDMGARINVGRTYVNLQLPLAAEKAYLDALDFFPKPKKGRTYYTRVAPKDLMVFINLAALYTNETPPRLDDAAQLLRRAISLRTDFVDAYQNYGSVLIKQGKSEEAENVYRTALGYQSRNADLHYNLGVVLLESGRTNEGISELNIALSINPNHSPTMFALASKFTESTQPTDIERGRILLERVIDNKYELGKAYFQLAMLETDMNRFTTAAAYYALSIEHEHSHRSALFNLALLYRNQLGDHLQSVPLLERLLQLFPNHVKSYMLLGDIELAELKHPSRAVQLFQKAVDLDLTNIQARHNLCVALADDGRLDASERCLIKAIQMAPDETYLKEHLMIVRNRMKLN